MTEKKITKKEMWNIIKAQLTDEKQITFIDHEIELLEKKSANGTKKLTADQKANEVIKENILTAMESGRAYTVSELMKDVGIESNQKMSALLRQLVLAHKVVRTEDKRKAYFTKVAVETADE